MSKIFMPDADPKTRMEILEANADSIDEREYYRSLKPEEVAERKDILADNSTKILDLEEQKKEVTKSYNEQLDPLKKENKAIIGELKSGQIKVAGKLYKMPDYESGMMEIYDDNGELLESRRLRPEERQARLFVSK